MREPHSLLRAFFTLLAAGVLTATPASRSLAAEPPTGATETVALAPEVETARQRLRVADGLKLDLFAAEPMVQNPVNFTFDEQGRAYVVESFRRRTSVFDIRNFPEWLEADFTFRSVDDRINFLKKSVAPDNRPFIEKMPAPGKKGFGDFNQDGVIDWHDLEVESERVRQLTDADGDGRADRVTTFADGFNTIVSGVAAGVLAREGKVWFTCIPDLWQLADPGNSGTATGRTKLLGGFGVHIAFGGHDMHGLIMGPDGKIYFSIADRGSRVTTKEGGTVALPDTGAIFRCEPDGSGFEVVATGLRNPQELAFDDEGNLWTGDNNGDGGDKARWIHVLEGADYGWRLGWQWLPKMGAWNSERLWHMASSNTASWLLPPAGHVGHGPAGIAWYPGTGLPKSYDRHFFMADFPGGIRAFTVKPQGATFEVVGDPAILQDNSITNLTYKIAWNLWPVDIAFSPSGGLYIADWVDGWEKTGKGRVWRLHDPAVDNDPVTKETKKLINEGMAGRGTGELLKLLGHRDQRVRLAAQFELAKPFFNSSGDLPRKEYQALVDFLRTSTNTLARIHAIWALGRDHNIPPLPKFLLRDADPEVRAQALRVLAWRPEPERAAWVIPGLYDPEPRVRLLAAQSLGKLGNPAAIQPLIETLRAHNDRDAYLRHAAVYSLVQLNAREALRASARNISPAVRLGVLLAMRRLGMPEVAGFLQDAQDRIALEAARAINDEPVNEAMPQLAALLAEDRWTGAGAAGKETNTFILRRAVNANFRLGGAASAQALAAFARRATAPVVALVEAIEALAAWTQPPARDKVVGLYRPLPARDAAPARDQMTNLAGELLAGGSKEIQIATAQAVDRLALSSAGPALSELVKRTAGEPEARVAALAALGGIKHPGLAEAAAFAARDENTALRKEAAKWSVASGSAGSGSSTGGSIPARQAAIGRLGENKSGTAKVELLALLDQLLDGSLPKELELETLEAARQQTAPELPPKLKQIDTVRASKGKLGPYLESLVGGDASLGKKLFLERQDIACVRCHKVQGEGGEVGPELTGISRRQPREYLLESMVQPNASTAPGFGSVLVKIKNVQPVAGIVKSETKDELVINSPEDGLVTVKKADILAQEKALSAMPEGLGEILSRRELRDLVEFLATQ